MKIVPVIIWLVGMALMGLGGGLVTIGLYGLAATTLGMAIMLGIAALLIKLE